MNLEDGHSCPSCLPKHGRARVPILPFSGQGEIRTPKFGGLSTARLPVAPLGQQFPLPAEGKGFEPSSHCENRVSSAVRPTVSGYLPNQPRVERREDCCGSFPLDSHLSTSVDPPGIEPGSLACKAGILPLNDRPVARREVRAERRVRHRQMPSLSALVSYFSTQ